MDTSWRKNGTEIKKQTMRKSYRSEKKRREKELYVKIVEKIKDKDSLGIYFISFFSVSI